MIVATYRKNHDTTQILTQPRLYSVDFQFHIDLPSESIDGMSKAKAFDPFRQLLPNAVTPGVRKNMATGLGYLPMNDQNQISRLGSYLLGQATAT